VKMVRAGLPLKFLEGVFGLNRICFE